jgi:hypothetical protein
MPRSGAILRFSRELTIKLYSDWISGNWSKSLSLDALKRAVRPLAVGHCRGQIGEHRTRGMSPRPRYVSAKTAVNCADSPVRSACFPQQPHPGVRHHPAAIGGDINPRNLSVPVEK